MRLAPLLVALLPITLGPAPGAASEPGLHSFTLDNGLMVAVIEDHRAPVVMQMVWYRVGAAEDPAGQSGMAHFLEHLMFKATDKLAEGDFERIIQENGGNYNAFTSLDHTAFVERVAADRLDLVMSMEADRMVNLAPSEASVLSERDVVIEERRQVVDGNPGGAFNEKLMAALHPNSPDGRSTIGSEQEIARLTQENALAFYRAHYAPNNAILVVAGDIDAEEVRQAAERHFGPIPASTLDARAERQRDPPPQAPPRIEVHDARVPLPQLSRVYLAPQRRAGDQKQAAAVTLLAELLGGARVTSVLSRNLVGANGIALAADASYSDMGLTEQSFGIYVVPMPGIPPAEAEGALDALIARFLDEGPVPEELRRTQVRLRAANIYKLDDVSGRAHRLGEALASGLTLEDIEAWPDVLQSVTVEDVKAAAAAVFRNENAVTGWLMPSESAAQELPQ